MGKLKRQIGWVAKRYFRWALGECRGHRVAQAAMMTGCYPEFVFHGGGIAVKPKYTYSFDLVKT